MPTTSIFSIFVHEETGVWYFGTFTNEDAANKALLAADLDIKEEEAYYVEIVPNTLDIEARHLIVDYEEDEE
jgi:hypothetical protein